MIKLPFLVEHFVSHQEAKPDMSFQEFLVLHYLKDNENDSDYLEDMKLPFKSEVCSSISVTALIAPVFLDFKPKTIKINEDKPTFFGYYEHFTIGCPSSIFHPPKFI